MIGFERSRKGFRTERAAAGTQIHCWFFTVLITKKPVLDKLFRMLGAFHVMKMERAPDEMACFAGDEAEPAPNVLLNKFVPKSVPHRSVKIPKGRT